ncbi:MAG TPA: polysaccharide deacetylase family protein [Sporolactobacillaceae bacterium]|nr:polysaccharide deacetylase family protein [Sporolactobacillaceae bacterium]
MSTVALSFDNGPDPEVTPLVLDVLARRNLKASFFVLGKNLASPERMKLAERAAAEGHRIGNHSYTHRVPLGLDPAPEAVEREIGATENLLGALAENPKMFRPFGGGGKIGPHLLSPAAVHHLIANHYTCVLWNSVPEDWIDQNAWVARALADAASRAHTLVVMHDILPRAMSHLDGFIGALLDAGHRIAEEFPAECVPIVGGEVVRDISGFVSGAPA